MAGSVLSVLLLLLYVLYIPTYPSRAFVTIYDQALALVSPILRRSVIQFRLTLLQATFVHSSSFDQGPRGWCMRAAVAREVIRGHAYMLLLC